VDLRNYSLSVGVLRFLNIRSLQLMTNNPEKIDAVRSAGIEIARRVSADVPANPHSAKYLATKRNRLGHLSNLTADFLNAGNHSDRGASFLDLGDDAVGAGPATLHLLQTPNRKG